MDNNDRASIEYHLTEVLDILGRFPFSIDRDDITDLVHIARRLARRL